MKICPTCKTQYPDDANFCPQETCATPDGPQRLQPVAEAPKVRFQPSTKMGGGNTGEVWRARDNQTGADVAYKVVNQEALPTPTAVSRAERELKQLQRVASAKVAVVIDCGRTPEDRLYLAMELCEGESLERILKNGPLPFDKAKAIVAQVGQALLEAQKAGIVHRDVAPKNVIVGATGDVKVINFPIAVPVNEKVSGVPAYVSPEQAQGKPVDQRSNTYSLACIFYHLLTGEPPFTAATPQAVLDLHVSSPPLPPSQRRPGATLSPDVDRVLLKALDKNSSRRHLTLRLFLTEVEALTLASAPAPGAPASKDVGFAKTMLFAGGQQEVANLVAKAIAARTGGTAPMAAAAAAPRTTPASMAAAGELNAAPARAPTPAPVVAAPAPAHVPTPAPAAVANTVMAASGYAPEPGPPTAQSRLTPPPVTPVPPEALRAGAAAGADKNDGKGGAFRETLWFKKGDVDQMVAEAKAKLAAQGKLNPDGTPIEAPEDVRPLEDRYVDDGTVTAEDRKKFSLRTGGTTAMPRASAHVPGEDMSESDVMQEMAGTRKTMILVVAGVLVAALLVVVIMMMRGKGSSHSSAPTPSPTLAAPAAAAPAPPPPPAPAAAPRPEPKPAAVAKRDPEAGGAARDGAKKRASRKKSKHRR